MKLRNKFLFIAIFLFFIILSSGIVFAEDSTLPQVEDGVVSGGVEIPSVNPFTSKSGELVYQVPANVSEIKSVNVVVSSYSGSGAPTYGLTTKISLKTGNTTQILEYANLTYPSSTANDPVIYPITNLTSKQYSDYQTFVNITDKVKSLSPGDKITISVNNTKLEGYEFDGRIKLIALTFAYDDGDNDKISYWLNVGQAWTKGTLTTLFKTKDFNKDYDDVTLESIALSSSDATYNLNGQLLTDPIQTKGSYYIYDVWNITDAFELSKDTNFTYTSSKASTYASYKAAIQLLKVNTPEHNVSATITPEYKYKPLSIYAGAINTLTIDVTNGNEELNGSVQLLIGDEEVAFSDLFVGANNKTTIKLIDPTIRPINETTVNGVNNTVVNYTLNILSSKGGVLNSTSASYIVVYNGYLGKDYEYPNANPTLREFTVSGDVIVLTNGTYAAGAVTNRNDVYTVAFDGNVSEALLYVPYNWDKDVNGGFNSWNTTFNGQVIAPIASYRDQSNLGSSAKNGYGLVVYNVTDLVVAGKNTFTLNKTGATTVNVAVYPSNLIILTNNNLSKLEKTVYILEEADLLSTDYNKNAIAGFSRDFDVIDDNATLYVFAASAQNNEGNLIINGEFYKNVWNGTSNSFDIFTTDVDSDNFGVFFEATGSTILGLHQMVVVVNENKTPTAEDITIKPEYGYKPLSVYAGVNNTLTITVKNSGKTVKDVVVKLLIDDNEVANQTIAKYKGNETITLTIVDPTIRPITENTINGKNNEKVNYTVVIEDANGKIMNKTNASFIVVYDGYLGKDYEYPNANPTLREFTVTGEVIVLTNGTYAAGAVTNRTDVYNVAFDGIIGEALLYVPYNWDKDANGGFNSWNTTFNGQVIAPIVSYRDQSNLGSSAKNGYGLVVYDVTDLVVAGENIFELNKTANSTVNAAVYPSNLIVLTNNKESEFERTVYIYEEADLLSKSYNKNLPAGFNTTFSVVEGNATLYVFAASAQNKEGNLIVNGETYSNVWSGTSESFDIFNTDVNFTDLNIYFEATGSTILGLHQMVVVSNERLPDANINVKTEYTSTPSIYAGVINNLTVTVENTGGSTENVVVKVLMGNETISIQNIDDYAAGETYTFNAVDATIRPITENTVNGNNNEKVNYTVVVEDADGDIINSKIVSCVVVYDGYLGKDYEYPKTNSTLREFVVRGEVIVLVTDEYSAGSATNRTDKFNLTSDGNVTQALLYVSYNWDKDAKGDFNNWNTTFNGKVIAPIASYRDQSNLGGASAKYGYGLVVYDVTDLVVSGVNTFEFNKTKGTSAVYPSNLIVLVENKTCPFVYNVYILEEADLLSKSYNKNLPVGFNTTFSVADGDSMVVVFAASAQAGEGNLIVNGETHTDVWNGTSNSLTYTIFDFNSTDLSVYFESTGATILGLHQMVVVINENTSSVITAPDVEKYYKGPERFVVNVADYQGNPIVNKSVEITINGVTYTKTTDKNGNASIGLGLGSGVYTVTTKFNNTTANSIVTVLSTVNGTDLVKVYQNASQYYATFRDSQGNYLAEGTTVKFNINGVLYERKVVGNQGLAKLNINLQQGDYIITAMNTATGENCANNITVLSKIIENKDITKYYKNGTQYTVKLVGDDGKAVGAGEVVTFNINGVFYNRTTNASGIAKLNINLSPGDYIITAEYKGCKVSNQITVKPVLSAEDLTKKYGTPDQFVANLLDGQGNPATGENVTFNINGEFYSRTTDSDGNAKLNIRLMPGEYIITSSYNGTNVANTVKVTA